jgi:hypothetical protein
MKFIPLVVAVALSALVSMASTLAVAQDNIVTQLSADADYKTAQSTSAVPVQPGSAAPNDVLQKADQLTHEFAMHREDNKVYELIIVSALALIALFMVLRFLTAKTAHSGPHIVSATGLICIIFGTIIVGIMAQTDQQMTAAVGILGAVAGYLFRAIQHGEDGEVQRQSRPSAPAPSEKQEG